MMYIIIHSLFVNKNLITMLIIKKELFPLLQHLCISVVTDILEARF